MTSPVSLRQNVIFPRPEYREAVKRMAKRQGLSVSQFIVGRLMPLIEHELRDGEEPPVRGPAEGGGSKASGPLYED